MAFLIDTGIFITLEREERAWREFLLDTAQGETFAIAAITASELLMGVHRAAFGERRLRREQRVEEILNETAILPFDLETARIHARIRADLTASGQMIGPYDLLIAATALAYDYAILTYNAREFARIPGLEVRQPGW